jgi:hypothetical protein
MAVTSPKKAPAEKKPDRSAESMVVIQVTRGYLADHPPESFDGPRQWATLLAACGRAEKLTTRDLRCEYKTVTRGDNSCTYAWAYVAGHPQAPPRNVAWFREGPDGKAMLYQQGWRAVDPPDDPPAPSVLVSEL